MTKQKDVFDTIMESADLINGIAAEKQEDIDADWGQFSYPLSSDERKFLQDEIDGFLDLSSRLKSIARSL